MDKKKLKINYIQRLAYLIRNNRRSLEELEEMATLRRKLKLIDLSENKLFYKNLGRPWRRRRRVNPPEAGKP